MQGMPARAGEAGGAPAKQPEGMDREARLLTSFAEVALHSKAWVRQAPGVGACINVFATPLPVLSYLYPTPHYSWLAVSSIGALMHSGVHAMYTGAILAAQLGGKQHAQVCSVPQCQPVRGAHNLWPANGAERRHHVLPIALRSNRRSQFPFAALPYSSVEVCVLRL